MTKTLLLLALLAPGLALVGGCSTDHGAYAPVHTTVNNLEDVAKFVALDQAVQSSVTAPSLQEGRLPDGRLQVAANLRNMLNRRIQVQVDCVFKDAQGFAIDETPFQNLFLDENAQETVRFVSASDKAQRYTVRVRQAR